MAVDRVSSEPLSGPEFPANREIYREICEFGVIIPEEDGPIVMNPERFRSCRHVLSDPTEQGIITPVSPKCIGNYPRYTREIVFRGYGDACL